jgi:hypothetical protein
MKMLQVKILFALVALIFMPISVMAAEHQGMQMSGDHGSMASEKMQMGAGHGDMAGEKMQMDGGHDQMMSHPEMMDDHMKTHHEHVKTMERVFRYERNLAEKAERISVAYLYKKGDHESEKDRDAMVMMAQTMVTDGLAGKSISFEPVGMGDDTVLAEQLAKTGANVIYIGKNLSRAELGAAKDYAVQNKILTIGSSGAQTEQGTTAVGIDVQKEKVDLIISLVTAQQQGVEFDPRLYRLADKIIK